MIPLRNAYFFKAMAQLLDRNYREYLRLLFRYRTTPRYQPLTVRFLDYTLEAPDAASFVFQFKDIFIQRSYAFHPETPAPVIYDCGANIGMSSLFFKSFAPHARIRAFEADPSIAGLLERNLHRNGIDDVHVTPAAVWTHARGVPFHAEGADAGFVSNDPKLPRVPSVRLKTLLNKEKSVDFLKMDIEGSETEVLLDCGTSLAKVRRIFVEYHGSSSRPQQLDTLLLTLSNNGFAYHMHPVTELASPFETPGTIRRSDHQINIFAERG